ncbi:MAG: glycosyltransferase family 4 protein [Candidatus Gastranaerophilales bacterium]|nr:glycosyltransferase family 4 protein [Candidatus Gastranaerophilales bacterium]
MKIKFVQKAIDKIRGKKYPRSVQAQLLDFPQNKKLLLKKEKSNKILMVYHRNFLYCDAGNNQYAYNITKTLKELGYSIDFFAVPWSDIISDYDNFDESNKAKDNLVDNLYLSIDGKNHKQRKYYQTTWCNDDAVDKFDEIIGKNNYDYIFIHYVNYLDLIRFSKYKLQVPIVLLASDFDSIQNFLAAKNQKREPFIGFGSNISQEIQLLSCVDKILCISNDEKCFFKRFYPDKQIEFLPFFDDLKINSNAQEKKYDCVFLGANNYHNVNSLIWFEKNILPELKKGIKIYVCGKVGTGLKETCFESYQKMLDYGAKFIDFVENLDDLYSKTKISIAPMVSGTGMKIKTITSMSYGIPTVTTELGVDGFIDKSNNGCLVSDNPKEFASYIEKLLEDSEFYNLAQKNTIEYFKSNFSKEKNKINLEKILGSNCVK